MYRWLLPTGITTLLCTIFFSWRKEIVLFGHSLPYVFFPYSLFLSVLLWGFWKRHLQRDVLWACYIAYISALLILLVITQWPSDTSTIIASETFQKIFPLSGKPLIKMLLWQILPLVVVQCCREKKKHPTWERVFLTQLLVAVLLITHVVTVKCIKLCTFICTAGILTYPITYIITDILAEIGGKSCALEAVYAGFWASILYMMVVYFPCLMSDVLREENLFQQVFSFSPGFVLGSMIAYLCSQSLDIHLFDRIRKMTKGRRLWLRNVVASFMSHWVDTLIFSSIAWFIFPLWIQKSLPLPFASVVGYYLA